jgi:hypothetical protein
MGLHSQTKGDSMKKFFSFFLVLAGFALGFYSVYAGATENWNVRDMDMTNALRFNALCAMFWPGLGAWICLQWGYTRFEGHRYGR